MWKSIVEARNILRRDPWRRPEMTVKLVCSAMKLQPDCGFMWAEAFAQRALDDSETPKKVEKAIKQTPQPSVVRDDSWLDRIVEEYKEHGLFPVDIFDNAPPNGDCDNSNPASTPFEQDALATVDPFEDV